MIEVKYKAQLGNNLFQYCFGRILAENLGFRLKAEPIPGFPNTGEEVSGNDYSAYPAQTLLKEITDIKNRQKIDLNAILADKTKRHIIVEGFFQRYEYYKPYKEVIRNNWLLMDAPLNEQVGSNDIVVHVRRGDVVRGGIALPFSYYKEALKTAKYKRVFLCTNDPDDAFLELFQRYQAKIIHTPNNELMDLRFIMSFNKIILSASTFGWWAAFLSCAQEIYFPVPLVGYWSSEYPEINLRIDDEDRYFYIKCKELYHESIREKLIKARQRLLLWKK